MLSLSLSHLALADHGPYLMPKLESVVVLAMNDEAKLSPQVISSSTSAATMNDVGYDGNIPNLPSSVSLRAASQSLNCFGPGLILHGSVSSAWGVEAGEGDRLGVLGRVDFVVGEQLGMKPD